MKSTEWTADRVALLTKRWAESCSASEIARELGAGATRCAVIGKARRLGLPAHGATVNKINHHRAMNRLHGDGPRMKPNRGAATSRPAVAKAARVAPPPKPAKPKLAIAGNGSVYETADSAPMLPPVSARAWSPLPGSEPVTIMGLCPTSCRWPVDLIAATEAHFCGLRAIEGAYCGRHSELSAPKSGAKEHLDRRLGIPAARAA